MEGQTAEITPNIESKNIQHSDVTLVFGQGPVQEYEEGQAEMGRTGLNFFSRLNAVAAAEMLIQGKTERVILSGGQTGAKREATEADLMADVIRRRIQATLSEKSKTVDAAQRARLESILQNGIKIENQSKDTIENFVNILNQYIDADSSGQGKTMTMLGTGFHAQDTYSGTGIGRLEKLAKIFDVNVKGQVVSAEEVLRTLAADPRRDRENVSYITKELDRLTQMATHHEVAQGKSRQEKLLVELLDRGDWLADGKGNPKIAGIRNPARLKHMLQSGPFVTELLQTARHISSSEAETLLQSIDPKDPQALALLQEIVKDVAPLVMGDERYKSLQVEYGKTKGEVLANFETLRSDRIRKLLNKPTLTDYQVQEEILQSKINAAEFRIRLRDIINEINKSQAQHVPKEKLSELIAEKGEIMSQLDFSQQIASEEMYHDPKSYVMKYGKGEDPRKK